MSFLSLNKDTLPVYSDYRAGIAELISLIIVCYAELRQVNFPGIFVMYVSCLCLLSYIFIDPCIGDREELLSVYI